MQHPTDPTASTPKPILSTDSTCDPGSPAAAREKAFGIWSKGEDGVAYQERMRSEWEDHAGQ
jgi:hypothetical protein